MAVVTERDLPIARSKIQRAVPEALVLRLASIALLLVLWQLLSFLISAKYIPGPLLTFSALAGHVASGAVWKHFTVTMVRMLASFALSMVTGVVIGTLMGLYR